MAKTFRRKSTFRRKKRSYSRKPKRVLRQRSSKRKSYKKHYKKGSKKRKSNSDLMLLCHTVADRSIVVTGQYLSRPAGLGAQGYWVGGGENAFPITDVGEGIMYDPQVLNNMVLTEGLGLATKLCIESYRVEHVFKNVSNTDAFVTEYRCTARNDVPMVPSEYTSILNILGNFNGQPTLPDPPYGNAASLQSIGMTPFDNPQFVSKFKIVKVKNYQLTGGSFRKVAYRYGKPRLMNSARFNPGGAAAANIGMLCLKGCSFSIFVHHGGYIGGATSGNTTDQSRIGVTTIIRVSYKYVNPEAPETGALEHIGKVGMVGIEQTIAEANPTAVTGVVTLMN